MPNQGEKRICWMRDIERIDKVLETLRRVWLQTPDSRLGQLIMNATGVTDMYYLEEVELLRKLEAYEFHLQQNRSILRAGRARARGR
jgi:hypothetical protein